MIYLKSSCTETYPVRNIVIIYLLEYSMRETNVCLIFLAITIFISEEPCANSFLILPICSNITIIMSHVITANDKAIFFWY